MSIDPIHPIITELFSHVKQCDRGRCRFPVNVFINFPKETYKVKFSYLNPVTGRAYAKSINLSDLQFARIMQDSRVMIKSLNVRKPLIEKSVFHSIFGGELVALMTKIEGKGLSIPDILKVILDYEFNTPKRAEEPVAVDAHPVTPQPPKKRKQPVDVSVTVSTDSGRTKKRLLFNQSKSDDEDLITTHEDEYPSYVTPKDILDSKGRIIVSETPTQVTIKKDLTELIKGLTPIVDIRPLTAFEEKIHRRHRHM